VKVVLEEHELAVRVLPGLSAVQQLKDVTFGLAPGAVKIGGKFQVGFSVPFETQWTTDVLEHGRKLGVRLAHVSVGLMGLTPAMVSSQVMNVLSQKLQGIAGVAVENEVIILEPSVLLASKGIGMDVPVKRVDVFQGRVEIEVG